MEADGIDAVNRVGILGGAMWRWITSRASTAWKWLKGQLGGKGDQSATTGDNSPVLQAGRDVNWDVPIQQPFILPTFEVLNAGLVAFPRSDEFHLACLEWTLWFTFHVERKGEKKVLVPHHRCHGSFEVIGRLEPTPLTAAKFFGWEPESLVRSTGGHAIIDGAGRISLQVSGQTPHQNPEQLLGTTAKVSVSLLPIGAERPIVLNQRLEHAYPEYEAGKPIKVVHWYLKPIPNWPWPWPRTGG
jgi:hypothetical protein